MRLPRLKLREVERVLVERGCTFERNTGSHQYWRTPSSTLIMFSPGRRGDKSSCSTGVLMHVDKMLKGDGLMGLALAEQP